MNTIRTSSLFHYTKKNFLKQILANGFHANYCKEELSLQIGNAPVENKQGLFIGIPMVSFCDVPIMRASVQKKRYGAVAIGLTKEWGLKHSVTPVSYITNLGQTLSLIFYKNRELDLENDMLANIESNSNIQAIKEYVSLNQANINLLGYVKQYEGTYKGKKQINYLENEWRFVLNEIKDEMPWHWDEASYSNWRGDERKKKPELKLSENQILKFTVNDISHIIVEKEKDIPELISYIHTLKQIGGGTEGIKEEERNILYSHITSFDRISRDY